jgi:L,D-transpeptidase ErfK/SrfK
MFLPYRAILKTQATVLAFALLTALALTGSVQAATKTKPEAVKQTKFFSEPAIGKLRTVKIEGKETLYDVAAKYFIGYAQLIAANPGVDPWLPGTGTEITLPEWHILPGIAREGILLNTAELRLYYFPKDGSEPKTFPIGIGREGLYTPLGTTTIVSKTKDPSWRPTPRMRLENPKLPEVVEGGDPDNPLGAFALYLGWPSYRIHGTNMEKAIGRRASSGCIRMYKPEITWMYQNVAVGTKVTSINEPIKMAWIGKEFYVEAEPSDMQIDEIEYKNRQITVSIPDGIIEKIRAKAGDKVDKIDWEKVRTVLIQRTGLPTDVMLTN